MTPFPPLSVSQKGHSMSTALRGAALVTRARELSIPGRSKMSADELRAAIAAVSAPVPAQVPTRQVKINTVKVPPFRASNGKRKPSLPRRNRR